ESVGYVVSRVILFGTILTKVHIVPDMLTDLPTAPELPAVSPFLCSDDSEFELADEFPEIHLSPRHFSVMVSRWRAKVISRPSSPSGSSSPDTTISSTKILVAPIPPALSIEIATGPPACDILTLVIITSPAVCSHIRTTVKKSTLGLRPMMMPAHSAALRKARLATLSPETSSSKDYSHHSSKAVRSPSRPLTHRRPQCSDYATLTSSSSTRPSRKRSRSSATSIPSTVHSSDEGSLKAHAESDMDSDIRADIEAETTAAAMTAAATIDGLEGTIEIVVDVTTRIGIPYDLPMPDTIERLEQLKKSVQGYVEDMLRQVDELRAHRSQRLGRMETFLMRSQSYSP
ncbi:hypothetical protein Tco_0896183, partial [Tanacetum coccineum]